ncbi:MAG TPA: protein kinase [Polyangiaceae bacterium]|nr:protein kinase [Polyangiaceae bacterium]
MSAVDARPQPRVFQPGHIIADKYELEALVGEGGMGSVWRARHRQLESALALKLMSPAIASMPDALERFLREAKAAARLSSQHVVKVFDYGVDGDTPFIAMELLNGESLRQRLDRCGKLTPESTAWVIRQAARALAKAHAEGIVHRDLKPENLFITQQEDEVLKVLDFGVAKLSGSDQPSTSTRTGALLGTPFYMSPEQARGIKALDHRSDIWSLGVIAFECLTGQPPFESEAFGDLVLKICTLPAPVPSSVASVPDGFDAWFARVTERDPERRCRSMEELAESLQALIGPGSEGKPAPLAPAVVARTEPAPPRTVTQTELTAAQTLMANPPRRSRGRRWLFVTLAGLLGAGALFLLTRGGAPEAHTAHMPPAPTEPTTSAAAQPPPVVEPAPTGNGGPGEGEPGAGGGATAPRTDATGGALPVDPQQNADEPAATALAASNTRSATSTARARRKPAAPSRSARTTPAAKPAAKAAKSDLFSDPD